MAISPETDAVIEYLNELAALDPQFMFRAIDVRFRCNDAIADHPTVQVASDEHGYSAGLLGVINGYLGAFDDGPLAGWGPVTAIMKDGVVLRFERTDDRHKDPS